MEGSGRGLLSEHLSDGTEETCEKYQLALQASGPRLEPGNLGTEAGVLSCSQITVVAR
jgi:hypothetical protein